ALAATDAGTYVERVDWRYFIDIEGAPDAAVRLRLADILAGHEDGDGDGHGQAVAYVVPRLGTISPWSSKATDILRGCGLPVRRVERGQRLLLAGLPAGGVVQPSLARALHDP